VEVEAGAIEAPAAGSHKETLISWWGLSGLQVMFLGRTEARQDRRVAPRMWPERVKLRYPPPLILYAEFFAGLRKSLITRRNSSAYNFKGVLQSRTKSTVDSGLPDQT
jgi:hypothetical protein